MPDANWAVRPRAPAELLDRLDVGSPLLAQLLINRGIADRTAASRYLDGVGDELHDPLAMAGMAEALDRLVGAIRNGEAIVIYGDYDVDGLSGATLLLRALEAVGARAAVFIPHRERDGYGLNARVLARLAAEGARLVISVDCGVSAAAEVDAAARAGLDVVVTDHHRVPAGLPRAVAVLNPHRRDCAYPFKALAGAGVALKLAQALARRLLPGEQVPQLEERLLELAALGTVADVMPLVGENRAIVRRGLRCLNASPSPGLRALLRLARLEPGWIDAEAIAYKVAPRLNAAGRLDDAILAHRLLAARDDAVAEVLAQQIEQLNGARRALTDEALARARYQVAAHPLPLPAALVLDGDYPTGVLGLLAARLTDETGRPVAVIRTGDRLCRGSVRGVDGFDTVAAVEEGRDLLLTFGGHHAAAGLTLPAANLAAFRARFAAAAESALAPLPAPRPALAECRLRPASIDWALCEVLARLEPCGEGNPPPLFESRGWLVRETRVVGDDHLRLRLSADSVRLGAIFFRGSGSGPSPGQTVDLLHRVRRSPWQDAVSIELEVVAWRAREG